MVHITGRSAANENSSTMAEERSRAPRQRAQTVKEFDDGGEPMTGRHTFAFWTIVWLIFVLTVGNLILTLTIIGVLRLGRGMAYMELVPEADSVKFFGSTDLDHIYKKDGLIEGFADVPMSITGDKGDVEINLLKANGHTQNKMLMSKNGTQFNGINHFDIRDAATDELIFTTHRPTYNLPTGIDNLRTKSASTSRLSSPIDEGLQLNNTKGKLLIRGSEGVSFDGKEIVLSADQNVQFRTVNGSIYLDGKLGTYLDMKNIPVVEEHDGIKLDNKQYKICVCMPQGRLYRVPITNVNHNAQRGACAHFSASFDPCAM